MDLGSLIASFGADLTPLQRSVAKAKALYNEYQRTAEKRIAQTTYVWMKHGKRISSTLSMIRSKIFNLKTAMLSLTSGFVVKGFLDVASSFEQMRIKLDALTKGKGLQTLEEMNAWALKMPVNTRKAVDTFTMMKAMALDPTIKSLELLTDVAIIFGEDTLPNVARALGQIKLLGKLSIQELNQLANAGINARKYLKEAFGTAVAEEINKAGYSVDQIVKAIMIGMERDFGGAARKAMDTWRGVTNYLRSVIIEFERYLASAGIFDLMKQKIKSIADSLFVFLKAQISLRQQNLPNVFDRITEAAKGLLSILESISRILLTIGKLIFALKVDKLLSGFANVLQLPGKWLDAINAMVETGEISFKEFATSNFKELSDLLEKRHKERQELLSEAFKFVDMGLLDLDEVARARVSKLEKLIDQANKKLNRLKQISKEFKADYVVKPIRTKFDPLSSKKREDEFDFTPKINLEPYNKLIDQLNFEISVLKKSQKEQQALNLIRQLGIKLTDEQKNKIIGLVDALYSEQQALQISKQYKELVNNLRQELEVLGKSNEEKQLSNILRKFDGQLTKEQVENLRNLISQIEKKRKEVEKSNEQDRLSQRIIEDSKTLTERFNQTLQTYNELLKQGKINQIQYNQAIEDLKKSFGLEDVKTALMTEEEIIRKRYENYKKIIEATVKDSKEREALLTRLAEKMDKELSYLGNRSEDLSDRMSRAFEGWARNFASYLNDVLWNSKVTFGEIAKSFAKMVTQMIIQTQLIEPLFGRYGIITNLFTGKGTAQKKHTGGIVGSGGISIPVPKLHSGLGSSMLTTLSGIQIPKFHKGGLMPDEYVAVLKKGEGVFTPEQMRALGGGSQVNVIVNNNTNAKTSVEERTNSNGGKDIIITIDEVLGEMISNDVGKVSKALRLRGLNPNIVRR